VRALRRAGCEVVPASLPSTKAALAAYYILAPAEAARRWLPLSPLPAPGSTAAALRRRQPERARIRARDRAAT
jgi:Asp-tRNA(Asn)/Glu-tRNA(Gln) amidotransferase A subunit family amidase